MQNAKRKVQNCLKGTLKMRFKNEIKIKLKRLKERVLSCISLIIICGVILFFGEMIGRNLYYDFFPSAQMYISPIVFWIAAKGLWEIASGSGEDAR